MNEIVNTFLLAVDKFMPEMHIRQPGFTCSACGPLKKTKKEYKNKKKTGDSRYIYQNELGKACFQHDMAYGDFKDLIRRTASDKLLRDKAFNIAKNPKYDGYQRGLASMVYRFFDKKTVTGVTTLANKSAVKNKNMSNKELAEELHKLITRKFKRRKL